MPRRSLVALALVASSVAGLAAVADAHTAASSTPSVTRAAVVAAPSTPRLRRGSVGEAVRVLQQRLNALGFDAGTVDGRFGPRTLRAVLAFQRSRSLAADGIVGPRTWAALGAAPAATTTTTTAAPATTAGGLPSDATWDAMARCESGGRWDLNLGTGYYGGLQFMASSWRGVGGTGVASDHPREEQIRRANILWQRAGFSPWPSCARKLGLL